jgi:hypothetical protein
MDHDQAMEQKSAERYLLNELAPDARDAFEEHLFDCPDCALDVRAGSAFVDEARVQLPGLTIAAPLRSAPAQSPSKAETMSWLATLAAWMRPQYAVPAFAALLLVVGYQNVVTVPNLRASANEPRLVPVVPVHGATRGASHTTVIADRKRGVSLPIDIVPESGAPSFTSYSFELHDTQHKLLWSSTATAPADSSELQLSLEIPGAALSNGSYSVSVFGVSAQNQRTPVETHMFDIQLAN